VSVTVAVVVAVIVARTTFVWVTVSTVFDILVLVMVSTVFLYSVIVTTAVVVDGPDVIVTVFAGQLLVVVGALVADVVLPSEVVVDSVVVGSVVEEVIKLTLVVLGS